MKCKHERRVTPEGQYTTFRCLDCGFVGNVPREQQLDPDVPILQAARAKVAAMVERGECSPAEASAMLGHYADSMRRSRAKPRR